jgi:N-acyl-L-homoserine lactone synthetase
MVISFLFSLTILLIIVLILGQVFLWEATIWTNLSIALASIWAIFLLNAREIIRAVEILFIEIAVKILDLIAYCQGYRVCKAEGHHLEEVYKLRHRVYLETNYISEAKEHDIFVDSYDPFSTNLVVIKNKKVIGTLRIIFYNKLTKLSTLNYFNLDISEDELPEYVDVGRWVNDPDHRAKKTKNPIVTILLGLKLYLYLLKSRKKFIIVTLKTKLKTHIEKIFNISFTLPNMLPLTSHHKKSREEISGYFKKQNNIEVCMLEVKTIYLWKFFYRL